MIEAGTSQRSSGRAAKRPVLDLGRGALLVWLIASPVAAQAGPTAQDEAIFKAGFVNACMENKQRGGGDASYARAFCLCAVHQFQAAMSQDEFREVVAGANKRDAATFDLPQFARGMSEQRECGKVGTFDGAAHDGAEAALLPQRRFERFSIRLPEGFVVARGPAGLTDLTYSFFRIHADLQTTTVLAVGILPVAAPANLDSAPAGDELRAIAARHLTRQGVTNLVHRAVADLGIGTLTFKATQWSGSIRGRESEGVVYVARWRDDVIVLAANDVKAHAAATLPIMQASMKTFVFYGGGQ